MANMEMQGGAETRTSAWIKRIWPVQKFELKKVLPLLFLKFLVSVVYSTLTCMKDSLVVTADHSVAEVIPVLKGWVVFPLSLLCAIAYSKLSNHFKRCTLFYSIIAFFLLILFFYGFVLYPNVDRLSPHTSANLLTAKWGAEFTHWISVYRNWMHSLFFTVTELWGPDCDFYPLLGICKSYLSGKGGEKNLYSLYSSRGSSSSCLGPPCSLLCL